MTSNRTFVTRAGSMVKWLIAVILGVFAGMFLYRQFYATEPAPANQSTQVSQDGRGESAEIWTCSMHPQIRMPKPGQCPICFMDLIPVAKTQAGQRQAVLTEDAIKLMEIETARVERKFVDVQVPLIGKVDYDESRVKTITAWAPGRIDRLYVDFTGIRVAKGDHMVYLYSPSLLSAQAELIQAAKSLRNARPDSSGLIQRTFQDTLEAAREKLRLLGLTAEQIETVEKTGKPQEHLTIYAPIGGVVIEKMAKEGTYVETGERIYTIADLSQVWIKLDAYETDLLWLRYGQTVEFRVKAYPGKVFQGRISFIDPFLNPQTRTVKLRVNAENSDGRLKPEMLIDAVVKARPDASGDVSSPEMMGKWICPMHLDMIKDQAGICDICQMKLETAESLGFASTGTGSRQPPLVIPASAALVTGTRAVVYVQVPDTKVPTYEGREIVLGARAGDYYLVKSGLQEGDIVVTRGSFKIDADLQIQAKPSMMNPSGGAMPIGHEGHRMESATKKTPEAQTEQTICPVMGGAINKDIFTDYKGKKVYFCCPGCIDEFKKNPEKYIGKLPQFQHEASH